MPRKPEAKPDRYAKEICWVPRAAEGFGTCFTVAFSGPEIMPTSWEAYEGQHKYPARPIWHAELPKDGQMVWVLAHEQPISETDRKGIEEFRQVWHQFFMREAGVVYEVLEDKRAFIYSADVHGTRFFIDISMPI